MALKKKDVKAIYEALSQRDVQNAADEFSSVYEKTDGKMDMSAWRSILIWRMTPKVQLRKPADCGPH